MSTAQTVTRRPSSLASIDPRTATARRATSRVQRTAGAAVKSVTFNSAL